MAIEAATTRIALRKILYLTDFSRPSEAALPFAMSIARSYGAVVNALHVLIPAPLVYTVPELNDAAIAADEELSQEEMERVDAQLIGIPHETAVERGAALWPVVEGIVNDDHIDLIVVGTHGRTGSQKLLLGSVAEEVFRKSTVPVLTIGPSVSGSAHKGGRFSNVLLATDFGTEAEAASRYAISLAQENQARLTLLHVLHGSQRFSKGPQPASIAEVLHRLSEIVPPEAELWCRPEPLVEYGEPAKAILLTAKSRGADLIVLGLHSEVASAVAATPLLRATAHRVVAHSLCPVLTARS